MSMSFFTETETNKQNPKLVLEHTSQVAKAMGERDREAEAPMEASRGEEGGGAIRGRC